MRTKLLCGVSLLASLVASVGAAGAADLAVKAPIYKAAPPVILSDWAGFYVGVNGGGGWGSDDLDFATGNNVKTSGGLIGAHAGYNWQFGSYVIGVEGDFDAADISKTDAGGFKHKTDELGTVRARAGYVFMPNLLAYGTAGYAYGHTTITPNWADVDQNGWVAGAGVEYKVWGPLIARGEYLHYDFDKTSIPGDNLKTTVDVVRGGLSYKF
jgi:outer membrane immunogenic protein